MKEKLQKPQNPKTENEIGFDELFKILCNLKNEKIENDVRDEIYKALKPYNFIFKEISEGFNSLAISKDKINFASILNALQEARQILTSQKNISKQQAESFLKPEYHPSQIAKDCISLIRKKINGEINIQDYIQELYNLHDKYPNICDGTDKKSFKENADFLKNLFSKEIKTTIPSL